MEGYQCGMVGIPVKCEDGHFRDLAQTLVQSAKFRIFACSKLDGSSNFAYLQVPFIKQGT